MGNKSGLITPPNGQSAQSSFLRYGGRLALQGECGAGGVAQHVRKNLVESIQNLFKTKQTNKANQAQTELSKATKLAKQPQLTWFGWFHTYVSGSEIRILTTIPILGQSSHSMFFYTDR